MSWKTIVNKENFYRRLDKFLRNNLDEVPLSALYKFLRKGKVYVNGKRVREPSYTLNIGDEVSIRFVDIEKFKTRKANELQPQRLELSIIYEDEHMLAINKKAGIALHPGRNIHVVTLIEGLLYYGKERGFEPHLVHRLDLNTSGVLIVAKDKETARLLTREFKERNVNKWYIALVKGKMESEEGKIDIPLDGLDAFTEYRVLKSSGEFSLLEVKIKTGRKHQIRRHLSKIGHPVVGDNKYGIKSFNREIKRKTGLKRQFLHCSKIRLKDPYSGRILELEAELPDDLKKALKILGLGR